MRNGFQIAMVVMSLGVVASAVQVQVQVSSREVMLGEPFTLRVAVVNAQADEPPTLPKMADFDSRGPAQRSESSETRIFNGRRTSSVTVSYDFSLVAKRLGKLTIPGFVVKADGMDHRVEPIEITVIQNDAGDLLIVELESDQSEVFVEEPFEMLLKIWLLPAQYRGRPLGEEAMWSSIDRSRGWGVFADKIAAGKIKVRKAYRTDDDGNAKLYYLYECSETVWPEKPGRLELEPIQILVQYPLRLHQSVFGDLRMTQSRKLVATPSAADVMVKPIPLVGRPEIYEDAVGQFQIHVTAQPTKVRVGDPVTLNIEISGTGRLKFVKPPNLTLVEALTKGFKVHEETLPGQIDEGVKRFTQSIRAETDAVTEIPPIPFCYFDPKQEKFVTIHSDPVPIHVEAGEQIDAADVVAAAGVAKARLLTEVGPGLLANYSDPNALLASQSLVISWRWLVVLGASPAAYLSTLLITRRRRRFRENAGLGRRRYAAKTAKKALKRARQESDSAEQASLAANMLLNYIADRLDLPSGGMTRPDAVHHLRQRQADDRLAKETDDVLSRCEAARFARINDPSTNGFLEDAWQCIQRMEKAHWA